MKKLLLILLLFQGIFLYATNNVAPKFTSTITTESLSNIILDANLSIVLIPIEEARPGFKSGYQLIYENKGTIELNGAIELIFDHTKLEYVYSSPISTNRFENEVHWDYINLQPGEQRVIFIEFSVFLPSIVAIDDVLSFIASITPLIGDEEPQDNFFELRQTVVNSFDPNDKRILEGEQITIDKSGDYLHFIVRFQNLGTAAAINVRIHDDLEEKLDWSTFERISTSHAGVININGSSIDFVFNNINLPPEEDDPEGSKGFVVFKVKPVSGINVGDVIRNRASIYFDFNEAVITNTAEITYIQNLSTSSFDILGLQYYPNPVRNKLFINTINEMSQIEVFDVLGRSYKTVTPDSSTYLLDISELNSGNYFVKITSNTQSKVIKIIKL